MAGFIEELIDPRIFFKNKISTFILDYLKSAYLQVLLLVASSIFAPLILSAIFGVAISECFSFFLYALVYHGLNGVLILSLFKERVSANVQVSLILVTGICYNTLSFFVLSFFYCQKYVYLNVVLLLVLKLVTKTSFVELKDLKVKSFNHYLYAFLFFLIPVFIAGSSHVLQNGIDHHFTWQGALANSLINSAYPYYWHLNPDVPLYYNYGYHLEMACCSVVSSLSLDILSTRIYPVYVLFLLISFIYSFCKEYFIGKAVTGWLTFINNFCVVGFGSLSTSLFLIILPASISLVGSSALAMVIFFALIDRIYKSLTQKESYALNYLYITFLFFVGAMTRSAFAPVLIGGLSLLTLTEFIKSFQIKSVERYILILVPMGIAFVISLFLIYGFLSPYSATEFLTFVKQNTIFSFTHPKWLTSIDQLFLSPFLNDYFLNLTKAIIYILLIPGYLVIGFYYQVYKWRKEGVNTLEKLLLFCAIVGIVIWNFTWAPGGSHYTFHHYASLIAGIFGANGTFLLFRDALKNYKKPLLLLVSIAICLSFVKGYELYTELRSVSPTLAFGIGPQYSYLPKNLLEKVKSMAKTEDNAVFVSMIRQNAPDSHYFCLINRNVKYYEGHYQGYLFVTKVPHLESRKAKFTNLLFNCQKSNVFDHTLASEFKGFFPNQNLIFLVRKNTAIESSDVKEIEEVDDYKLFKISQ